MNMHPLTLKELLRLSYANNLVWLSGEPKDEILIEWVVSSIDEVHSGDILLLPGRNLDTHVMVQARDQGGSALILVGAVRPGEVGLPPNFPVISLPGEADLREVHRVLLNILVNRRASLMERGVSIHTYLSKLAVEGGGLSGLVQAMADLAGRSVLVQDKRLGILADYPSTNLAAIWDGVLKQLVDHANLPEELSDRKKAGKATIIHYQKFDEGLVRIVTPISVSGIARGYLSLVDINQPLDALDHLIAEQGSLVCAIEMARAKAVREAEKRLKGDLLTALLQENITPRDANLWVQSMGLDLDQSHVAVRFAWDGPSPPSMRRLETMVNGIITGRGYRALVEALGTEIVCICQVKVSPGRPDEAINFANAVAEIAIKESPDVPMRCGIGLPARNLQYWRDSFRQAGQALEMARRLQVRTPQYFPDLSVYRLLLQLEHHPDLQTFKDEILGELLNYEGGGDLIRTLEVYFDHNGNYSQAAEALFIHRNTLIYRMERISEISGLDLDNTETRLAVQLALRVHRMMARGSAS